MAAATSTKSMFIPRDDNRKLSIDVDEKTTPKFTLPNKILSN